MFVATIIITNSRVKRWRLLASKFSVEYFECYLKVQKRFHLKKKPDNVRPRKKFHREVFYFYQYLKKQNPFYSCQQNWVVQH